MNELLTVKEELAKANIKMKEMNLVIEEKEEELNSSNRKVSNQEAEINSLKGKIKEFQNLSENLEVLEKTRRQLEDLQEENKRLKDLADQTASSLAIAKELNKEKDELVKEFTLLKSNIFEEEQKSLQAVKSEDNLKEEVKKYKVIEEIREMLLEVMLLYKTLETLAREGSTKYTEKLNKIKECVKLLSGYVETVDKQERLNMTKVLHNVFPFFNSIPKKKTYLNIIDNCVISCFRTKQKKVIQYEDLIIKYKELANEAVKRYSEFELKLSCYNISDS